MGTVVRLSEAIIRMTFNLAAGLLALAVALVFYQVLTRFLLGEAAVWSEVLARAVIVWGVFLTMGPAIRHSNMIPIDVIRSLIPERAQIWLLRVVTFAMLIFLTVLIWYGYKMTLRVMSQQVAMLDVSVAWFYGALPIGALLALPGLMLVQRDAERSHRQQIGAAQ